MRHWCREAAYRSISLLVRSDVPVRAVLMYHSISDRQFSVNRQQFEQQIRYLAEHFETVPLCDFRGRMAGANSNSLACVTFDDGYRDNYEVAAPILERFGVKATFFVATAFIGGTFVGSSGAAPMMEAAHLKELSALGHEIGAHTHSHRKLTTLPSSDATTEVETSRNMLADLVGERVTSFAYPKGDCDGRIKGIVMNAGFADAVTTQEALVTADADRLTTPRLWIGSDVSTKEFAARLSSATTVYRRLRTLHS